MNTRTKFTSIPKIVKQRVYERDNRCCVLCGQYVDEFYANAHIVPRSKGGLGIDRNIITLCPKCHYEFDHTTNRKVIYEMIVAYIKKFYPDWQREDMIFRKGTH